MDDKWTDMWKFILPSRKDDHPRVFVRRHHVFAVLMHPAFPQSLNLRKAKRYSRNRVCFFRGELQPDKLENVVDTITTVEQTRHMKDSQGQVLALARAIFQGEIYHQKLFPYARQRITNFRTSVYPEPHKIAGQTSPSIHPPTGNSYAPRDFLM